MKKILFTLAAVAMVLGAASCQKENLGQIKEVKTVDNPLNTILVKVASDTKLAVDSENLKPAFEENDVIFGWDKEGNTYAYTCTEVTEVAATFTRTSSGAPSANDGTNVNLVYAPGYGIDDIVDKTLDVNLAVQGETLPVVMHAMGEVDAQGLCEVTFDNDVAIVDIKDAVLPGAVENEEYTIAFHGKYTSLKFALNEFGDINYEAAVEGPISSSVKAKASADSKISKRFAVPASLEATDVTITATAADGSSYVFSAGSKEIVAGKYITVTGKEFAPQYVAEIEEVQYTSLAKAVEAANEAGTAEITILEDCTAPAQTIAAGKTVTLDLNGKTVTSKITTNGELTIKDGAGNGVLRVEDDDKLAVLVDGEGSKCTLESGTVIGTTLSGNSYFTFRVQNGGHIIVNGGVIESASTYGCICLNKGTGEIKGGTFKNELKASGDAKGGRLLFLSTDAVVTINGGTFTSAYDCIHLGAASSVLNVMDNDVIFTADAEIVNLYAKATVNIENGGYFNIGKDAEMFGTVNNATKTTVTSGYYTKEPNFITPGYMAKLLDTPVKDAFNNEYLYEVVESTIPVAEVITQTGTVSYTKVADAIKAAKEAGTATVKLLEECDLNETIDLDAACNITMDLNGKQINVSGTNRVNVAHADAKYTVESNDENHAGIYYQTGTGSYALQATAGNLIVNSGKVTCADNNGSALVSISSDGILTVNGGVLTKKNGIRVIAATNTTTVNVTGGLIEMTSSEALEKGQAIHAGGKVNISGGRIVSDAGAAFLGYNSKNDIKITGGEFETTVNSADSIAVLLRGKSEIKPDAGKTVKITNLNGFGIRVSGPKDIWATLTIDGDVQVKSMKQSLYVYSYADVTVLGGTFESTGGTSAYTVGYVGSQYGKLWVKGGSWKGIAARTFSRTSNANAVLLVYGGQFAHWIGKEDVKGTKDGDDLGSHLPDGYIQKSDGAGDYPYYVVKSETPIYPGTDKAPVKIGNIWWAPVNCGGDSELYKWNDAQTCCPSGWRTPTADELTALVNTGNTWSSNPAGYSFNGGTLFFLAAGYKGNSGDVEDYGNRGYYWSSTEADADHGIFLRFYNSHISVDNNDGNAYKNRSCSVRCVKDAT